MPRPYIGPRLYYDSVRQSWVIRDGHKFVRTGAGGWKKAQEVLEAYWAENGIAGQPPQKRVPPNGYVYFVSAEIADYPIKIGWTEKLNGVRLSMLQTGNPHKLIMLATARGTFQDENGIHKLFAEDRLCGEWFRRSDALLAVIEDFKKEAA